MNLHKYPQSTNPDNQAWTVLQTSLKDIFKPLNAS